MYRNGYTPITENLMIHPNSKLVLVLFTISLSSNLAFATSPIPPYVVDPIYREASNAVNEWNDVYKENQDVLLNCRKEERRGDRKTALESYKNVLSKEYQPGAPRGVIQQFANEIDRFHYEVGSFDTTGIDACKGSKEKMSAELAKKKASAQSVFGMIVRLRDRVDEAHKKIKSDVDPFGPSMKRIRYSCDQPYQDALQKLGEQNVKLFNALHAYADRINHYSLAFSNWDTEITGRLKCGDEVKPQGRCTMDANDKGHASHCDCPMLYQYHSDSGMCVRPGIAEKAKEIVKEIQ